MKAVGLEQCTLIIPDGSLIEQINAKHNNKYSEEYVRSKLEDGMSVLLKHGVGLEQAKAIYLKAMKILDFSKDCLDLKLAVFDYLGISERYLTHPADLIQSSKLTYSRAMFLKERTGMVLVNDIFQKRMTFERKYGDNMDNFVQVEYPLTNEIQEEILNYSK